MINTVISGKKTFWCKCSVAGGGCGSQARVEEGSTVQMFSGWRRVCVGVGAEFSRVTAAGMKLFLNLLVRERSTL